VIFLGLEDSAFGSFATQVHEGTCAFFVAFSHAKMRVLFTFRSQRTTGPYHQNRPQAAKGIRPLYEILHASSDGRQHDLFISGWLSGARFSS
jgi:hypothetical protein